MTFFHLQLFRLKDEILFFQIREKGAFSTKRRREMDNFLHGLQEVMIVTLESFEMIAKYIVLKKKIETSNS